MGKIEEELLNFSHPPRELAAALIRAMGMQEHMFRLGASKIFLKHHIIEMLEVRRTELLCVCVPLAQISLMPCPRLPRSPSLRLSISPSHQVRRSALLRVFVVRLQCCQVTSRVKLSTHKIRKVSDFHSTALQRRHASKAILTKLLEDLRARRGVCGRGERDGWMDEGREGERETDTHRDRDRDRDTGRKSKREREGVREGGRG